MKNYHALLLLALPTIFACEKPDPVTVINHPAIIEATVPAKVYLSPKEIVLDASASKRLNPNGELYFLWSCTKFPSGAPPQISNASEAIAGLKATLPGIYEIILKAWSTSDNENTRKFTMEVLPGTPVISPLPDMYAKLPDNYVKLNAEDNYRVNPGRYLYFKWRILEAPTTDYGPSLSEKNGSSTLLIVRVSGKYVIQLDVTNEINLTTSDSFVVNVIADPLSGTEIIFDNLFWKAGEDYGNGPITSIIIKEQNTYRFRTRLNTILSVWDDGNQKWIDNVSFDWSANEEGLFITAPYIEWDGLKTKIKLKYL